MNYYSLAKLLIGQDMHCNPIYSTFSACGRQSVHRAAPRAFSVHQCTVPVHSYSAGSAVQSVFVERLMTVTLRWFQIRLILLFSWSPPPYTYSSSAITGSLVNWHVNINSLYRFPYLEMIYAYYIVNI